MFTPNAKLESDSKFNADGTITLVLDKSKITGLDPGMSISGITPVTHRITPTDGSTVPFTYGFRSVGANVLAYDDVTDAGFYDVVGTCKPKKPTNAGEISAEDKSGTSFGGAFGLPFLLSLFGFAAIRRSPN